MLKFIVILINLLQLIKNYTFEFYEDGTNSGQLEHPTSSDHQVYSICDVIPYTNYQVLTGTRKGTVHLWEYLTQVEVRSWAQGDFEIDSNKIFSCGEAKIYQWDISNTNSQNNLVDSDISGEVRGLQHKKGTNFVFYGTQNGSVKWFDYNTLEIIGFYNVHSVGIRQIKLMRNSNIIVSGDLNGVIKAINYTNTSQNPKTMDQNDQINDICQINPSEIIIVINQEKVTKAWNWQTGQEMATINTGLSYQMLSCTWITDTSMFVVSGQKVQMWDYNNLADGVIGQYSYVSAYYRQILHYIQYTNFLLISANFYHYTLYTAKICTGTNYLDRLNQNTPTSYCSSSTCLYNDWLKPTETKNEFCLNCINANQYLDTINNLCITCPHKCGDCDILGQNCNSICSHSTRVFGNSCQCIAGRIDDGINSECIFDIIVNFSDDLLFLNVNFQTQIDSPNFSGDTSVLSVDYCTYVFSDFQTNTQNKLGISPKCKLDTTSVSTDTIIIELGQFQSLFIGDQIYFNDNSLQEVSTSTDLININPGTLSVTGNEITPIVILQGPQNGISLCEVLNISVESTSNTGNRELSNFVWSLLNIQPAANQEHINIINYILLSQNNISFLTIDSLILNEQSEYTFQLQSQNFAQKIGNAQFTFMTTSASGIQTDIPLTQNFDLYTWKINFLNGNLKYLDCSAGLGIQEFPDQLLDIYWEEIDTSGNILQEIYHQQSELKSIKLEIPKYTFSVSDDKYIIQLRAVDSQNSQVNQKIQRKIKILNTALISYIEGGDRTNGHAQKLILNGVVKNVDKQNNQEQNINKTWQCKSLNDNLNPCKDNQDNQITFIANQSIQEFQEKLFTPYNSYQFILDSITTDLTVNKQAQSEVTIIIIELEIPSLTVALPENVQQNQNGLNMNDDMLIKIAYDKVIDNTFFNLIIIYDYDIVGTQSYLYNEIGFKIWDLYSGFNQSLSSEFILRITLYDPEFFMSAQSSFKLNINFPPFGGQITVTPQTSNKALDSKFLITVSNIQDDNYPLSYRYQFYFSENDYITDKELGSKSPTKFLRNFLTGFSNKNSLQTYLPYSQEDILLMVTVSDSLGAYYNITQAVNVDRYQDVNNINIEQHLQKIQDLYNNELETSEKINLLCILGQEISLNIDFQLVQQQNQVENYYQTKKEIYNQILSLQNFIQEESLKEQSVKVMNQIIANNYVDFSSNELNENFNQIDKVVEEQKLSIQSVLQQLNSGDSQSTKIQNQVNDILGKSLDFLDKQLKNIQISNANRRNLLDLQEKQQNIEKLENIQNNIKNTFQSYILANQDPIEYQGEVNQVSVQKSTQKIMENFIGFPSQDESNLNKGFYDDNNNIQNNNNSQENKNFGGIEVDKNQIFQIDKTAYKENIYQYDSEFPYPDQSGQQLQDINIKYKKEDDLLDIDQIDKQIPMNFIGYSDTENEKSNAACIQKANSQNWSSEFCETQEIENEETGIISIRCQCNSLHPTSVVNDLDEKFRNSGIQEAFSDENFQKFLDFEFYKSFVFYIFLGQTLILLVGTIYGHKLDKNKKQKVQQEEQNNQDIEVSTSDKLKQKEEEEIDNKIEVLNINENNIQSENNQSNRKSTQEQIDLNDSKNQKSKKENSISIKKRKKEKKNRKNSGSQSESDDIQNQNQSFQQSQQLNQSQNQQIISINSPQNRRGHKNKESPKISTFQEQQLIQNSNDVSETNRSEVKENQKQLQNNVKKRKSLVEMLQDPIVKLHIHSVHQGIIQLHELFSIYYFYDEVITRPIRFQLYYAKVVTVLAITAFFSSKVTMFENILIGIITGVLTGIPLIILGLLLKAAHKIPRIIGIILSILIIGLCYYLAITRAAIIGLEQANQWAGEYFISYLLDTCFMQPIKTAFKIFIINISIKGKLKCLHKFLYIYVQKDHNLKIFFEN